MTRSSGARAFLLGLTLLVGASCGTPPTPDRSGLPAIEVSLTSTEFAFSPEQMVVPAGERIHLTLENAGGMPHDFAVDALSLRSPVILGGRSLTVEFVAPLEPGHLIFYCAIPGHRRAGMKGTLVVTPAGST